MGWARWVLVALAIQPGLWMTFDGARALIVGDYITPRSGEYAGQLGPWKHIVSAVGLDPRGTPMKAIYTAFGLAWLAAAAACALGAPWGTKAMLVMGIATLWYLPIGTAIGLVIAALAGWVLWRTHT
ncbi:MAG: hypothetical protein WD749_12490 [Phycisphaerales bacterium]